MTGSAKYLVVGVGSHSRWLGGFEKETDGSVPLRRHWASRWCQTR